MNLKKINSFSIILLFLSSAAMGNNDVRDTTGLASSAFFSVPEMLKGQVAGVRVSRTDGLPGSPVDVNVRGINSFHSDKSPLWIIDGAMVNSSSSDNFSSLKEFSEYPMLTSLDDFAFLCGYDIESIEVLKNTAATAIYGSQGANGVIIVRTRMPKKSENTVGFHTNAGLETGNGSAGFSHNHYLSLNGSTDNAGFFLSGFYKDKSSPVPNTFSRYFGARIGFESSANSVVKFGMKAQVGSGKTSSTFAPSQIGYTSQISDFDNLSDEIRMLSSVHLDFHFTPNLVWNNSAGADYQIEKRYLWYGTGTELGLANSGVAVIPATNRLRENFNSQLSYSRYFSRNHVGASVGFDQQIRARQYNVLQGSTYFTEVLRAKGLSLSGAENLPLNYHSLNVSQFGAFAKLSYDFDRIAGFDASYRADFTRRYYDMKPVQYPSVRAYLNIDRLFPSTPVLSSLRIEGGYGASGKDEYGSYNGEITVEKGSEPYYETASMLFSREFNAGISAGFLGERIRIEAEFFKKTTDDSFDIFCFGDKTFGKRKLWNYSTRKLVDSWVSSLETSGVEFNISADIVKTSSLEWELGANFAFNDNKVKSIAPADVYGRTIGEYICPNASIPGYSAFSFYGTRNDGSVGIIGNPIPKWYGGLSTSLKYKGWKVEAVFDGAAGFDILDLASMLKGQLAPYAVMEKYVHKGDFIRLGRLSVGYDFKKVGFSLSGTDLFTLTRYAGASPDVNCFNYSGASQGIDCGLYPSVRSIILGINLKF